MALCVKEKVFQVEEECCCKVHIGEGEDLFKLFTFLQQKKSLHYIYIHNFNANNELREVFNFGKESDLTGTQMRECSILTPSGWNGTNALFTFHQRS